MTSRKKDGNYIYAIYCDVSDEWYIGRTCNPQLRFKQHTRDAQSAVHRLVEEYGENHIFMVILEAGLTFDEAVTYEAKYLYENYFRLNLVNRNMPTSDHLVPLCKDKQTTEFYVSLCDMVDKDINSSNPKMKFLLRKMKTSKGDTQGYSYSPAMYIRSELDRRRNS